MNIFKKLKDDVVTIGQQICNNHELLELATIEIPKDTLNGDLSTNIAMIIASKEGLNPRDLALKFKTLLSSLEYVAHIEVAGNGFINFTLKADIWHDCIRSIISDDTDFTEINIGHNEKINVEYVSANPTGPMHIGHARGAIYGDALARLLIKCGYAVTKEYYLNDAGTQIDNLVATALLRYKEAITKQAVEIPEGLYPGKYLIATGDKLAAQFGDKLLAMPSDEQHRLVKEFTVQEMMQIIKKDLKDLDIEHDIFFSEQSLHDSNKISEVIKELSKLDLVYEGTLPPPKGKPDDEWIERTQLLFRSTKFGDEQDRSMQKSNGAWTYLAADFAYAKDKIDRGFSNLVYVLGADHSGYVKRINGIIAALSDGKAKSAVKTCHIVNFVENGVPIKMSKRRGKFMTVRDVISEVDKDIIRFIMLTRKNDVPLDFDLEKVKEQSKDNPVFYVQYGHVRAVSILSNGSEYAPEAYSKFLAKEFDLSLLSSEEEIQIIKLLASWPKLLEGAAKHFEPHRIAFYLLSVAARFHSIWNLGKEDNDYRFIIEDNIELTAARLALAESIKKIISSGLEVIGITPLNKM